MVASTLCRDFITDETQNLHYREEVFLYFGTFSRTFLTMFEILFANWAVPCHLLMENISEWFSTFFLVYRCLLGFAVLNVVGNSMLVFVKNSDGILRALAIENGSVLSDGMTDSHDVSADAARMRELLGGLTREKIMSAWKQIASSCPGVKSAPPPSVEMDKSTLVTHFMAFFERARHGRSARASQSPSPARMTVPVAPLSPEDFLEDSRDDLDIELRFFDDGRQYDINAMLTMRKGELETMTAKLQKSPSDAVCDCVFSGKKVSAGSWMESLQHMTLEELEMLRSSMTKEAAQKPVSRVGSCLPALRRLRALHAKVEATLLFVEDMLCEDFNLTFHGSLIKLRDAVSEKIGQLKAADFIATVNAVFVQQTMKIASSDEELAFKQKERELASYTRKVKKLFQTMDQSGDGAINFDEFSKLVKSPMLQFLLSQLDLEYHDLLSLFEFLDNGDGQITTAKALDIWRMETKLEVLFGEVSAAIRGHSDVRDVFDKLQLKNITFSTNSRTLGAN
ncbi:unnamed protein product [Symbiodinium microadriaticum]|nr:unnamed protein product [Symbiodinium microadriaticum]